MLKTLLFFVSIIYSTYAQAECYSKYDYTTGNSYYVCHNSDGSTNTRGTNYETGSSWNQTTNKDNTYRGQDSDGNYYQGNNNSGHYYNYGTGKTCYGKGKSRVCY